MTEDELVAELKASLMDCASVFPGTDADEDADFKRHLSFAAKDLGRLRPRRLRGSLELVADTAFYDAPAGILKVGMSTWGSDSTRKPWDDGYPGKVPRIMLIRNDDELQLQLDPAPTSLQITVFGADMPFTYYATHEIGATDAETTILEGDRGLLILRAQAEAMKEMAMRNIAKPVAMRDGISNTPKNGIPAALHKQLMDEFESMAA